MNEKHVIQSVRKVTKNLLNKYAILAVILCSFGLASAQNSVGKISGKVLSEKDGEPLIGVSILVKGSNVGTVTDFNGAFTLQAKTGETLSVSYIGYTAQTVKIAGMNLTIKLSEDNKNLEEVVVVGYSSTQRKNLASSVAVINSKDLTNLTTTNVLQSLQGKIAGVQVTNNSGDPGSGAQIVIRGVGSFMDSSPLFVIDGIAGGDINSVSPQDIQSISVLKDAATAAIYGASAANGVVIITTKSGVKGAIKVNYEGSYGISNVAKKISMLNASQYVDLVADIQKNNGSALTDYLKSPDARIDRTNWQDAIFRTAPITEHSLRLSGGNESVKYSFSAGYVDQKSIIIDSKFKRINFGTKLSEDLFKSRLKLGQSIRISSTETDGNTASFYDALNMPPYLAIYNPSVLGGYARADKVIDLNDANNPFASVYLSPKTDRGLHAEMDLNAEVVILDGLSFKSQARIKTGNSHSQTFNYPVQAGNNTRSKSTMTESYSYNYDFTLENFFTYNKNFNIHSISLTAGNSYQPSGYSRSVSLAGSDFTSDAIQNIVLANTKSITGESVNGGASKLSYFGRVGYTYDNKYIFNATLRRDASSVFGANNRWGNFYGLGAAWSISKEDFMKSISAIDDLKLRISYGKTGNDKIGMFLTGSTVWKGDSNNLIYSLGDIDGTYVNGATIYSLPNPDLKWEETNQFDLGFDLSLTKGVKIVFDYFNRDNKDLLLLTQLPTSTGLGKPGSTPVLQVNGASMKNTGVEMAVTVNGDINKFKWDATVNATYATNNVYGLGTIGNTPIDNGNSRTDIGHPLSSYYGYKVDHVAIDQADVDKLNAIAVSKGFTEYQSGLKPGDRIWQDTDGNGKIDDKDRTYIGDPAPKFQYGITLNGEYKGFDLQVMLQGVAGVDLANSTRGTFEGMARPFNSFSSVLNRWKKPGDISTLPAAGQDAGNNTMFSDWYIEKGDYLRVKNIAFGYTLPSSAFKYGKLRAYIALQNVLTFTKYSGYDPEVSASDNSASGYITSRGNDNLQHPNPKIYRIGLQLNF
jgi:TonB-dependent starch-binding outer membrane protein SusC